MYSSHSTSRKSWLGNANVRGDHNYNHNRGNYKAWRKGGIIFLHPRQESFPSSSWGGGSSSAIPQTCPLPQCTDIQFCFRSAYSAFFIFASIVHLGHSLSPPPDHPPLHSPLSGPIASVLDCLIGVEKSSPNRGLRANNFMMDLVARRGSSNFLPLLAESAAQLQARASAGDLGRPRKIRRGA